MATVDTSRRGYRTSQRIQALLAQRPHGADGMSAPRHYSRSKPVPQAVFRDCPVPCPAASTSSAHHIGLIPRASAQHIRWNGP